LFSNVENFLIIHKRFILKAICEVYENVVQLDQRFNHLTNIEAGFEFIENPYKLLKKEFSDLKAIFVELGLWSFSRAYSRTKKLLALKLESFKNIIQVQYVLQLLKSIELVFDNLLKEIEKNTALDDYKLEYSSNKVKALMKIFQQAKKLDDSMHACFHSIVFVDRVKTAIYLDELFKEISKREDYKFLKSDFLFGTSQSNKSMSIVEQVKKYS